MTRRTGMQAMGDIVRNRVWLLPIYICVVALLVVAAARSWVDFKTSLVGAEALLMPSLGDAVEDSINVFTVAAMPQLVTIVFAYVALATPFNDQFKVLKIGAILLLIVSLALDIYTGYLFYSTSSRFPLAIAVFLDTAFSEIVFTITLGLTLDLLPDARRQLRAFKEKLSDSGNKLSAVGGNRKHTPAPRNMRKVQRDPGLQDMPSPVRATQVSQSGPRPPEFLG